MEPLLSLQGNHLLVAESEREINQVLAMKAWFQACLTHLLDVEKVIACSNQTDEMTEVCLRCHLIWHCTFAGQIVGISSGVLDWLRSLKPKLAVII